MKKPYAEVIVDIEHEKLDRPFTYRVPEAYDVSCVPGSCVRIPFGSGERELLGFVVGRKASALFLLTARKGCGHVFTTMVTSKLTDGYAFRICQKKCLLKKQSTRTKG